MIDLGNVVERVQITNNSIRRRGLAGALVVGNTSRNSGPGLRCDDPALWSAGSLTVGLNSWSMPQACSPAAP